MNGPKPDQTSGSTLCSEEISSRIKQKPLNCALKDKEKCQHPIVCDSALTPPPPPPPVCSISSKMDFDEVKENMEDINKALMDVRMVSSLQNRLNLRKLGLLQCMLSPRSNA